MLDITALNEVDIREQVVWENQRRDPRSTNATVFAAKYLFASPDDPPAYCDPSGIAQDKLKVEIEEVSWLIVFDCIVS